MLSKNQIKLITSLQKKKYRDQHRLFIAEGNKLVLDLIQAKAMAEFLIHTTDWELENSIKNNKNVVMQIETDASQMKKISSLSTPSSVLGVFRMPILEENEGKVSTELSLLLDDIQDPGNLGTIIRIADWFGIEQIFCSPNTVDLYNPKVIQATMGAITRINVIYTPLKELICKYQNDDFRVYGTFLEGEIIYNCDLKNKGFIIMGNEGKGISKEIQNLVSNKLFIPNYPLNRAGSESLNVSVATSIICSEFRRQKF